MKPVADKIILPEPAKERAGNVIGGEDFAHDRIIPDCIRAAQRKEKIIVRNPYSTRPYQHVLEPLYAYLMIAAGQYENAGLAGWYNVGPDDADCFQTGALVDLFVRTWGEGLSWVDRQDGGPHEASFLKLDCSRLKSAFGWKPRWDLKAAVEKQWSGANAICQAGMSGRAWISRLGRFWKKIDFHLFFSIIELSNEKT